MILGAKSLGAHGYGTENFSFPAAHAGKSWAILGSPNLWPRAALAAGHPGCLRHNTPRCGHAGIVRSLAGQQNSMGQARYGAGLRL